MDHVTSNMPDLQSYPTTATITHLLEQAVTEKAQDLIMKHSATLTTLSAAIVCEMGTAGEWGLFVCAVGDSPVYVYCPHTHQVIEATVGCHDGTRNMRMAGGVLGPSFGSSPDLSNLSYAFLPVFPGDIVFAVSDGVSDNFSSKAMSGLHSETTVVGLEEKSALKSCCENIPHLTKVLNQHQESLESNLSAQTVAACLINHSVEVTHKKRLLRAQCLEENIDQKREAARNPEFAAKLNAATGKLDHASVVAYQVGRH
jgi:serine/threonine protein phosphatase PrpC